MGRNSAAGPRLIQQRLRKKKGERAEASWAEMNACCFGPNEKENSFLNFLFFQKYC
jgi:hypothetical protein